MVKEKSHSALLGKMIGEGGDYYIGTQAVSNKMFSHILIGNDGATLTGAQIGNQDIRATRNYPAAMPGGYLICAGGTDYINYIALSEGYALGVLISNDQ